MKRVRAASSITLAAPTVGGAPWRPCPAWRSAWMAWLPALDCERCGGNDMVPTLAGRAVLGLLAPRVGALEERVRRLETLLQGRWFDT